MKENRVPADYFSPQDQNASHGLNKFKIPDI